MRHDVDSAVLWCFCLILGDIGVLRTATPRLDALRGASVNLRWQAGSDA